MITTEGAQRDERPEAATPRQARVEGGAEVGHRIPHAICIQLVGDVGREHRPVGDGGQHARRERA
ncbi:hypothetical protein, partial [Mesorhizobium japonicum]|uniref:hypothetical protein n=1 Tax=Mesorhizobium japonicum TaxID=2066070 RepID=UPI003B5990F7